MKPIVTRFEPEKAGVYQNGNLQAFDLVPEGKNSGLVFHWVNISKNAITEPEENTVEKTFLFFEGQCIIEMDGNKISLGKGDVLWLPEGSVHTIKNSDNELQFIVVKAK